MSKGRYMTAKKKREEIPSGMKPGFSCGTMMKESKQEGMGENCEEAEKHSEKEGILPSIVGHPTHT